MMWHQWAFSAPVCLHGILTLTYMKSVLLFHSVRGAHRLVLPEGCCLKGKVPERVRVQPCIGFSCLCWNMPDVLILPVWPHQHLSIDLLLGQDKFSSSCCQTLTARATSAWLCRYFLLLVAAGDNLLNDASARYMVNVPARDLQAAKAALTSDLAAAAKVAMFKPVDVSLCTLQMRPCIEAATGPCTVRGTAPNAVGRRLCGAANACWHGLSLRSW